MGYNQKYSTVRSFPDPLARAYHPVIHLRFPSLFYTKGIRKNVHTPYHPERVTRGPSMFDGAPIQKARITQAFKCLPPEISGLLSVMDRQKHYQGNPDGGIPAMTHFVTRRKVPRGMLKVISHWFSGNDSKRESRPEWGEYYASFKEIRGGEMRVSMRVEGDEGGGGVEVFVDVEIIHNIDDEIPNSESN